MQSGIPESKLNESYSLPGFPDGLTADQITMGPMTKQAIDNNLLPNIRKQRSEDQRRLVLMIFRSKTDPSKIYYELIPSSEKSIKPLNEFAKEVTQKLQRGLITIDQAKKECDDYTRMYGVWFVFKPDNTILPFEVTYTPTQRGTGVVHTAGLKLIEQFYGKDTVPSVKSSLSLRRDEYKKEFGVMAGAVTLTPEGGFKLTTRSNAYNAATCLYDDETLLLAMRHCFLPAEASEEKLMAEVKQMSQKQLNEEGAFCLFMTDLLCQLPLEISAIIHEAIKRDLVSSTQEYQPQLNENNKRALVFRDQVYPQLMNDKENLLNHLMVQLVLSSARAKPDRFEDDEAKRIDHNETGIEMYKDSYHPQSTYWLEGESPTNPNANYPTIERYLIRMTEIANQWAIEQHGQGDSYQLAKIKMQELLNKSFPCGPQGENQTILENAIYRHDLDAIEQVIKFGAKLTEEQLQKNNEIKMWPALGNFIIGLIAREEKKSILIKHICNELKIDANDPMSSKIAIFIDYACNRERSNCMGTSTSFAEAIHGLQSGFYIQAELMNPKNIAKWISAYVIFCIENNKLNDFHALLQNPVVVQLLKENIDKNIEGLGDLRLNLYWTPLEVLQRYALNNDLFLNDLPNELRKVIITPKFSDELLTKTLKESPDKLMVTIKKLEEYGGLSSSQIVSSWLFNPENFSNLLMVLQSESHQNIFKLFNSQDPIIAFAKTFLSQKDDPKALGVAIYHLLSSEWFPSAGFIREHSKEFNNSLIYLLSPEFHAQFSAESAMLTKLTSRLYLLMPKERAQLYELSQAMIDYQSDEKKSQPSQGQMMGSAIKSILAEGLTCSPENRTIPSVNSIINYLSSLSQKLTLKQQQEISFLYCIREDILQLSKEPNNDKFKSNLLMHIKEYQKKCPLLEKTSSFNLFADKSPRQILHEALDTLTVQLKNEKTNLMKKDENTVVFRFPWKNS